ncbi:MAG: DMT family transporter [Acidimicrobiia bacterium]
MAERMIWTGRGTHSGAFRVGEWRFVAALAGIWGSSFLFISIALEALDPALLAAGRVLLGTATLVLVPRAHRRIERRDRPLVALAGLAGIGVPLSLFAIAQQSVDSAVAGAFVAAIPVTAALMHMALSRGLLRPLQMTGIGIGFLGVLGMLWPALGDAEGTLSGMGLILLSVLSLGFANNLYAPLQQRYGSLTVIVWGHVAAAVAVTPFGLIGVDDSTFELGPVIAMIVLGIVMTGVARVLHITVVGRVGPARGAITGYAVPVVAVTLGVVVRGDTIEAVQLAGLAVTLLGGLLISRRE